VSKTPPLLPKKPKAPPPEEAKRSIAESKPLPPEPQITLAADPKLILEPKSTPPAAAESKIPSLAKVGSKSDFDSVQRADLLPQLLRPKAPKRRPPSAVLKQNGHSDSFEDKADSVPEKRSSFKAAISPKVEEPPKETFREPVKIELKKVPFMEELKGAVNQACIT